MTLYTASIDERAADGCRPRHDADHRHAEDDRAATPAGMRAQAIPVPSSLQPYVSALLVAEVDAVGPLRLAIAPHQSLMLSVQFGRGRDGLEQKADHGENTRLTGIREWTGSFTGAGDCLSLFALLTPLGCVQLLDARPLETVPRIRANVAHLLDRQVTRRLEADVDAARTLDGKLRALGAWIEHRAHARRSVGAAALRTGRAAMRLIAEPQSPIDELARTHHVSRRQLERDFQRWLGTTPHHLAQVTRVQAVSRKAHDGASLADIAADVGFADQAHMCRVVRQLTGLSPRNFVRSAQSLLATAFRRATGGHTLYL